MCTRIRQYINSKRGQMIEHEENGEMKQPEAMKVIASHCNLGCFRSKETNPPLPNNKILCITKKETKHILFPLRDKLLS